MSSGTSVILRHIISEAIHYWHISCQPTLPVRATSQSLPRMCGVSDPLLTPHILWRHKKCSQGCWLYPLVLKCFCVCVPNFLIPYVTTLFCFHFHCISVCSTKNALPRRMPRKIYLIFPSPDCKRLNKLCTLLSNTFTSQTYVSTIEETALSLSCNSSHKMWVLLTGQSSLLHVQHEPLHGTISHDCRSSLAIPSMVTPDIWLKWLVRQKHETLAQSLEVGRVKYLKQTSSYAHLTRVNVCHMYHTSTSKQKFSVLQKNFREILQKAEVTFVPM